MGRDKGDPTGGRGANGEMDRKLYCEGEEQRELLASAV